MIEKTLDGFKLYSSITANGDAAAYLCKCDIVSQDLVEYLKRTMPLITESKCCLQFGGVIDYAYTLDRRLEPLYMTFSEFKGIWRYLGGCFKYGTLDQTWR